MIKNKKKTKRPNAVIYFFAYIILMPFLKIFLRLEVDRSGCKMPKGSFVAISNHASFMDFAAVMLSLYPRRMNAVAATKFFLYKPLNWLLPLMGCIPKNLFDADARAIVRVKEILKKNGNVLIFPEGRCECDGHYAGMHQATGKLLKKLNVPVVACSVDGAYNCMPFWRKGIRRGRVRVVITNLFSREDLGALSISEINKMTDKRLSREEDPPVRKALRSFSKKRLAEGLENIIYWCPVCSSEFSTQTSGSEIHCGVCGSVWKVDGEMNVRLLKESRYDKTEMSEVQNGAGKDRGKEASGGLPDGISLPTTVHEWFQMQARYEAAKLHEEMKPISAKVQVRLPSAVSGGGMDTCGSGIIKLDPAGWRFEGNLKGETVSLAFPIDTVPALPIDPNDVFQIYAHGTFFCFVPEDPREVIKYSVIGECAYWKFASKIYMSPRKDSGFVDIHHLRHSPVRSETA